MKLYILSILVLLTILGLIAGAIILLSNRFGLFFPFLSQKAWIWSFSAFMLFSLIGIVVAFQSMTHPVEKIWASIGSIAISVFLFLVFSVLLTELLNLAFRLAPQIRGFITLGITLVLTGYSIWNAYNIRVKEVTVPVAGLNQEIRAVHLTDIHLGNHRGKQNLENIVRIIKELNPDVVFNTGDQFDSKVHFVAENDVLAAFRTLNIPHYFVYGNHDEHAGVGEVITRMKNAGATVLLNEVVHFGELQIIGLNNMLADAGTFDFHASDNSENIESVLSQLQVDTNQPTIILHHRPAGVNYMAAKGADLLLAGHTHAGQLFPFTFIAKWMFGYNKGLYKYDKMSIYVSQGVGTIFSPVRLGTNSEITLLKLVPDNSGQSSNN
jgi:predicted MPP superfamily phosphohydrolase